ncbi:response regulator transcription factor [Parapedobacter sp. ISTM3]|uniref:response regulator transcription factor n=1 Tax=Parapedobacter sp. ISTM3 TaxID=2800130 RepID=UPI0019058BCA|nr:response regulator transcription factor [Parapedobacter sp. ISTM3]MBK1441371.1 response regulator transcription factor [Parapedobacter sp. ISTM3]
MIKYALIDDHRIIREGIISLMEDHSDIILHFDASNGSEIQRKIDELGPPDIILLDIAMPIMDGYQSMEWLSQHHPDIKVLALSMHSEEHAASRMLMLGAKGFISKDVRNAELVAAMRYLHTGDLAYRSQAPSLTTHIKPSLHHLLNFSNRELEYLRLCAQGLSDEKIADAMCLSRRTVEKYREALTQRLNLKTKNDLTNYAFRNGLATR